MTFLRLSKRSPSGVRSINQDFVLSDLADVGSSPEVVTLSTPAGEKIRMRKAEAIGLARKLLALAQQPLPA